MESTAKLFIPKPAYNHPLEITLLERLNSEGAAPIERYLEKHTKDGVSFIGRDAAKRMFPEYVASPTLNNRYADGAASALADAARRTLLQQPVRERNYQLVLLTGSPASGKTGSVNPRKAEPVGIEHETILTTIPRASELIEQALAARRFPVVRLFYTDDPRINVQRMIRRAIRIGRTVPLRYMAETYLGVPRIVDALRENYGSRIGLQVINNSESPLLAVPHNRIERALYHVNRYTEMSALEAMYGEFDEICAGPISIPEAIVREARA